LIGLIASPNGEVHGVIIPVPVSLMEKAGTYRFVLHFYDDYADSYRNHQVKAALEVNQQLPSPALHVWVGSRMVSRLKPAIRYEINRAFANIGVTVVWHDNGGRGYAMKGSTTIGLDFDQFPESEAKRAGRGVHVLLEDWPDSPGGEKWYAHTLHPKPASRRQYTPWNPASTFVNTAALDAAVKNLTNPPPYAFEWALINTIIHELIHAASRMSVRDDSENHHCVMYYKLAEHHLQRIDNGYVTVVSGVFRRWTYRVPLSAWHRVEEIYAIRRGIGLRELHEGWLQR